MDMFLLTLRILETLSSITTAACMIVIAFELSPWSRKDKDGD